MLLKLPKSIGIFQLCNFRVNAYGVIPRDLTAVGQQVILQVMAARQTFDAFKKTFFRSIYQVKGEIMDKCLRVHPRPGKKEQLPDLRSENKFIGLIEIAEWLYTKPVAAAKHNFFIGV